MGTEYRRNYKNMLGKPDILGRDVLDLGAASLQAIGTPTSMTDWMGTVRQEIGVDARLEGVTLALSSGAMTLGRVGVEVMLDGAPVASGSLYAGGPSADMIKLAKGAFADVPVASEQVLTVNVHVIESMDTVQSLRASLSLALLEYPER